MCIDLQLKQSARVTSHPIRSRRQGGLSLIELIVFIVIVSVGLTGVLSVLTFTSGHSADPLIRKQMLTIAESLLEEVQMKPFTVCDPTDANAFTALTTAQCATSVQAFGHAGAATRADYNNVGNYCAETGTANLTCSTITLGTASSAASQIPDLTGVSSASPPGYWATIKLEPQPLGVITSTAASAAALNSILITVTVSYVNSSETMVLQGYRTRWAPSI